MSEQNQALSISAAQSANMMALFGASGVDLAALAERVQAQEQYSGSGGGGTGYPTQGMVRVEISKDGGGRFAFTNPFTGDLVAAKTLMCVVISHKFTLERWLKKGEVIEGIDPKDYEKKPLCRVVSFTDPTTGKSSDSGWFDTPVMSAYHATTKNLGVLQATGGYDGKQHKPTQEEIDLAVEAGKPAPADMTQCRNCPLAVKGLSSEEKHCKPAGVMEVVLFGYDGKGFAQPIKAFLRMPLTTIVKLVDDLDAAKKRYENEIKKIFGFYLPQFLTWQMNAGVDKNGGNTWAVVSFNAVGFVNEDILGQAARASEATKAILDAAANANTQQAAAPSVFGGAPAAQVTAAADGSIPTTAQVVPPAQQGGAPF